MQNAGISGLGLNWRYLAFEVRPEQLREAIEGARRMHFVGINLTVPHKVLALEMMDVLDDSARTWGAVNTVRFEGKDASGDWRPVACFTEELPVEVRAQGFNTDADAITRSIREDLGLDLVGKKVLLLGVGGAGRVAALKLASEGISELHLVNRTAVKAEAVREEIGKRYPGVDVRLGYPGSGVDLLLNATSLGLKETDVLPLDAKIFPVERAGAVYDMIYRPVETRLLAAAKSAGCEVANGLGMLLYQGVKALELWTEREPPSGLMREALARNVYGS